MNAPTTQTEVPWLSARVVAETTYCPRAGLIAFESQEPDRGQEQHHAPRLDYLPDFAVEKIEAALETTLNSIWRMLTWASPVLLVIFVISRWLPWQWWELMIPVVVVGVLWLDRRIREVFVLSRRLETARAAHAAEPDPGHTQPQPANWWSLLKAGFSAVEHEDSHEDPDLRLSGRPWRVLHKGPLRIPVFRKRSGETRLRPQHQVRLALYCQLLETCEGRDSPYGIVLFGDGYDGLTVPATEANRQSMTQAIEKTRQMLEAVRNGGLMPDTPGDAICRNCPLGRPRGYRPGETDTRCGGQDIAPFRTRGNDRRAYHSPCGDRFNWVPPHEKALEKGLR